jgi:hypothetical protein
MWKATFGRNQDMTFEKDFIVAGDGDDGDTELFYISREELKKYKVEKASPGYDEVHKLLGLGVVLAAVPPPPKSDDITLPFIICYLLNVTSLKKHTKFEDPQSPPPG